MILYSDGEWVIPQAHLLDDVSVADHASISKVLRAIISVNRRSTFESKRGQLPTTSSSKCAAEYPFAVAVQYHPERGKIYDALFEDFFGAIEETLERDVAATAAL